MTDACQGLLMQEARTGDDVQLSNGARHGPALTVLVGPSLRMPEGLSIAFALVVEGFEKQGLRFEVVDVGSSKPDRRVGTLAWDRAIESIPALVQYWQALLFARRVYIIAGLSSGSFLRDFLMIWTARLMHRRVVLHIHSGGYGQFYADQPRWFKWVIRETLMRADAIVVLGWLLCEQFSFLPNAAESLHVVPNALPSDLHLDRVVGKTLEPSGSIRLLYLSNLIETKGYLDCLEAFRIIHRERGIPARLDFCGRFVQHASGSHWRTEREAQEAFLGQIERMGLADVVFYHGVVRGDVKQHFLEESHVLVLPTSYAWEGQPISIIEALAFGTPVVATRFRGIPEQVIDGYNGFLIEPHNPPQIAECIERMWNEPERYREMSLNARRHFEQNFTQQAHLDRLLPIILGQQMVEQ